LAHRFCDRALLLYGDGRTESGAVDSILTAKTLSELYGYGLRQLEDAGHRCFIPE
jgi:iron complex transport system ATP-binding protein